MAKTPRSVADYHSEHEYCKCGYCNSQNTNCSYGMYVYNLAVKDYEALIDRGWRRCNYYCYKPMNDRICCPMYTIRCEALNFKVSKSQKKVLKRMAKYLRNELQKDALMDTNEENNDNIDIGQILSNFKYHERAQLNTSEINVKSVDDKVDTPLQLHTSFNDIEKKDCASEVQQEHIDKITPTSSQNDSSHSTPPVEMNSSQPACKKAKLLRKERKQNKLLAQGKSEEEIAAMFREHKQHNEPKSLEELFDEVYTDTNRLEIKLVAVRSTEYLKTLDKSAELYKKYQMIIHGDSPQECDKKSFCRFLVESPLQPWKTKDGPPCGYGSFHEQYWLDNELVAVGVIDILPSCISSVYFFYDPEYSYLSLGTFGSLREVYLTRQLNKVSRAMQYYYMGFYIHTCRKMRYKARMKPSKLLCPETYKWFDIEPCLLKLEKQKYSRFNDNIDAIDEDGVVDLRKVLVLIGQRIMPYVVYKQQKTVTKEEENEIKEYASLIGMKLAQSMSLYRR